MTSTHTEPVPLALDSIELQAVIDEIAADARRRREAGGGRPDRALALAREHRLGAVRLPRDLGGAGYSLREFFALAVRLAQADPDVPHILRIHWGTAEEALRTRETQRSKQWLRWIREGKIFAGAQSELSGQPGVYSYDTLLTAEGDRFRLNGRKFYSTGSIYADYLRIGANDEAGQQVSVVLPGDREGVVHVDDWDGIGQRETGSGTTVLDDVLVHPDEIGEFRLLPGPGRPRSPLVHLLLHAIAAGILRALTEDTATLLRERTRSYSWGNAELARNDPQLLAVVGSLSSTAFVVEAAVLAAADALDAATRHIWQHGAPDDRLELAASLQTAQVKVAVEKIALSAAAEAFDAGGASWTRASAGLDRHWRNLRTLFSHNPTVYKARVVGDVVVNDAELPSVGFF
ncbi:acyl-CoA dehydrogenase [Nocardia aobensis]|uniref:acyl-CoA dehydrogenase n=1 Tax=Nocardia aobensis TaxID=257277 RepID=UPI00056A9B0D|nr:acyl-CoA dehydrogenase [Nocardia aobensis]